MNTTNKKITTLGKIADGIALLSMIIGTIILGTFFIMERSEDVAFAGLFFMVIAFWVNLLVFLILIIALVFYKNHWKYLCIRMGILLLNIPIALLYSYIGIYFLDNPA
ncbi:MAG: hypothetical protein WCY89_00570 [Flavobacteriaceae bacterium]